MSRLGVPCLPHRPRAKGGRPGRATDPSAPGKEQRKGHIRPLRPSGLLQAPLCCSPPSPRACSLRMPVCVCVSVCICPCVSLCVSLSLCLSPCVPSSRSASLHPTLSPPHPGPSVTLDPTPGRLGHRTRPPEPLAMPPSREVARPVTLPPSYPNGPGQRGARLPSTPHQHHHPITEFGSLLFVSAAEGLFGEAGILAFHLE